MHITLVDDSIAFDGFTASARAMGGAEKAFSSLPGALARAGHQVAVFNRCRWSLFIEGAQWETFDAKHPLSTDVLIAFRKPDLLDWVRQAKTRCLWTTLPARTLERPSARTCLEEFKPRLLFSSRAGAAGCSRPHVLMPLAVRSDYLLGQPASFDGPPVAVVTTHPSQGLDWLLTLWAERIHPQVPQAQLQIYSMGLAKAQAGTDDSLAPLLQRIQALADKNISVHQPQGDGAMAQSYRQAWLHLYPGHPDDVTAYTLAETQSLGLPAVTRPLGAAPERVADGQTGYVTPDDDAFANLAILLLKDAGIAGGMGMAARQRMAQNSWDQAARDLTAWLA